MILELIYGGAGALLGVVAASGSKKEPAPVIEKQCAATGTIGNIYSSSRCAGAADARCLGGQCTAHCREHCKAECLK